MDDKPASSAGPLVAVTVRYFELIRRVTGTHEERVLLPAESTVGLLLEELALRHGDAFLEQLLGPDGGPLPNAVLQVDDSNILHLQGVSTPLQQDCIFRVILLPPFIGGG